MLVYMGCVASAGRAKGYAATIDGLPGGPPLAHWRLGEFGGAQIRDRKAGARHGTYSGTIGYGAAALPQNSDDAVDFAGTGSGSVTHDAGLALSAFSLSFWFKVPSVPTEGVLIVLVSKDQSGLTVGDFVVLVEDAGSVRVQFQSASSDFRLSSEDDVVLSGQPHHVCVRADNTGFDAYLDGKYLGKSAGFTGAWGSNTRPLRFAIGAAEVLGNCMLDEVALYNRVLTEAEVLSLAQQSALPVAVDDIVTVTESATTPIDVLANDIFVGTPTLELLSQPSGGDSVAVNGQLIDYMAGAVTEDTARTFSYRFTTPNGQSNIANVNVTVQDITIPPVAVDDTGYDVQGGSNVIDVPVLDNDQNVTSEFSPVVAKSGAASGPVTTAVVANQLRVTSNPTGTGPWSQGYQVTTTGGSDTATASGTVTAAPPPPPPPASAQANCFPATSIDTVVVSSMTDLEAAINAAPPGRHILIAPGTYAGGTRTFNPQGTEANPIVVRPRDGRGTVTINSPTWTLANGSSRFVLWNLFFNNSKININGQHHRVTRCQLRQVGQRAIELFAATDTRVDHCDISDMLSTTAFKCFVRMDTGSTNNGSCRRLLVDYNYCHDSNPTAGTNGSDFIGFSGTALVDAGLVIDHNRFDNLRNTGDCEMVGAKCRNLIFRFNTLINLNACSYVNAPRMGDGFEFRSNWVENTGRNQQVMIRGDNALVIGNRYIGNLNLPISAGEVYGVQAGGAYPACRNARVIGNRMGSGHIQVGNLNFGNGTLNALNTNVVISGPGANIRDSGGNAYVLDPFQNGTTFDSDSEPFVPAVRLATSDVGMAAPDPLCPSGPQS